MTKRIFTGDYVERDDGSKMPVGRLIDAEPDDPDFDYDNVIKVAKEMWGDPYGPDGEYKPEMISAAIAEIQRRKEGKPDAHDG